MSDREFDWWKETLDGSPSLYAEHIAFQGIMFENWSPDELAHMHLAVMEEDYEWKSS